MQNLPKDYPNIEKLNNNMPSFIDIQRFLEFLKANGVKLVRLNNKVPYYEYVDLTDQDKTDLIYKFHEINQAKLENERRMLLEDCA